MFHDGAGCFRELEKNEESFHVGMIFFFVETYHGQTLGYSI